MTKRITWAATVAAIAFAIAGFAVAANDRLVLGGTLLMFTAISIYVREITK